MLGSACLAPTTIGAGESHRRLAKQDEKGRVIEGQAIDAAVHGALMLGDDEPMRFLGGQFLYRSATSLDSEFRFGALVHGLLGAPLVTAGVDLGLKSWISEHVNYSFDGSLTAMMGFSDGHEDDEEDYGLEPDESIAGLGIAIAIVYVAMVEQELEPYLLGRIGASVQTMLTHGVVMVNTYLELGAGMNFYLDESFRVGLELGVIELFGLAYYPSYPVFRGALGVGFLF
jgi:hypothetical protein